MMKFLHKLVLLFALIAISALPAHAQNFPPLSERVVDQADILTPGDEVALTAKLEALEKQSGRQLVVATVPDLQGYPIEDFGYQLGRTWQIGQKSSNNGALLLVAPNERRVRVEIGYGLEPIVTDIYSGVIIRDLITPRFKARDYPGGINAGVDALIKQLSLPPEEAAKQAQVLAVQEQKQRHQGNSSGAVMFWLFIFFFFILPVIWPLIFGRRRGRSFGGGPVIIWGGGGGGSSWGDSGGSSWGSGGGFGGGFSGGGGSFGGGGASGSW
ncbi:MAG: hypothetical protein RLZZ366_73 [Pseudomonadota bacterium]